MRQRNDRHPDPDHASHLGREDAGSVDHHLTLDVAAVGVYDGDSSHAGARLDRRHSGHAGVCADRHAGVPGTRSQGHAQLSRVDMTVGFQNACADHALLRHQGKRVARLRC
jgi:hypothetical protein